MRVRNMTERGWQKTVKAKGNKPQLRATMQGPPPLVYQIDCSQHDWQPFLKIKSEPAPGQLHC